MTIRTIAWGLAACALALPASAMGSTLTVDPAASDGCTGATDKVCKTISQASSSAASGDTISIKAGSYPEVVTFTANNLTVEGAGAAATTVTGAGTSNVLTLAGNAITVRKLAIDVPADGGSAVSVTGNGAMLDSLFVTRSKGGATNAPAIALASAGLVTLKSSVVLQTAGAASDATNAAVRSTGPGGTSLQDDIIATSRGPGLRIEGSAANALTRTAIASTADGVNVVEIVSRGDDSSLKRLTIDSSSLAGTGATAAAILARSLNSTPVPNTSTAGPIELKARYLTAAGQGRGIVLDSSQAIPTTAVGASTGSITATVENSIVHGPSRAIEYAGSQLPPSAANNSRLAFTNSDAPAPDATAPGTGAALGEVGGAGASTPDSRLFINLAAKNLHLRQDAPVTDKGTNLSGGSATDIDGQPRALDGIDDDSAAQPDLGADEAFNLPSIARLIVSPTTAKEGRAVIVNGGLSTDPEAAIGGGIVSYEWSYGDGVSDSTTGAVTGHSYKAVGSYQVTVRAVDRLGTRSAPSAPVTVTVIDGTGPTLSLTRPSAGQSINRKRRLLTFGGAISDKSGVKGVELSLRVVRRAVTRNTKGKLIAPKALPKGTCEYYTGRAAIVRRRCNAPLFFTAKLRDFNWTQTVLRAIKLPLGSYQVVARATDLGGNRTVLRARAFRLTG